MSERLEPVSYEHEAEHPFLGQRMGSDSGTIPPRRPARSRRKLGGFWRARWAVV
jgi:hypothetical protein